MENQGKQSREKQINHVFAEPGRAKQRKLAGASFTVMLAVLLFMTGCQSGQNIGVDRGEPKSNIINTLPEPEGLLVFYRERNWVGSDYGLIDPLGNVVLPLIYDELTPLTLSEEEPETQGLERYYKAGLNSYYNNGDSPYKTTDYALVSPEGEVVTDHSYLHIARLSEKTFVALRLDENREVEVIGLDSRGKETSLTEEEACSIIPDFSYVLSAYREMIRLDYQYGGLLMDYFVAPEEERQSKTGPDLPEGGFDYVVEVGDGTYWGIYPNGSFNSDSHDKDIYDNNIAERFTEDGRSLGRMPYRHLNDVTEKVWVADFYDEEKDEYFELLVSPEGEPLLDTLFQRVVTWNTDPYLVACKEDEIVVVDPETAETVYVFPYDGRQTAMYVADGEQYLVTYTSTWDEEEREDSYPIVYELVSGETIRFDQFGKAGISDVSSDGTRFVLYQYPQDDTAESHFQYRSKDHLVDKEGNVLLTAEQMYFREQFCVAINQDDSQDSEYLTGLYDLNGQEILPQEFSRLYFIDGNALYVRRGDSIGIMDYRGNWIYRESVYSGLEG